MPPMTRTRRYGTAINPHGRIAPCVTHDMKKTRPLRQQDPGLSLLRVGLPNPASVFDLLAGGFRVPGERLRER